MAALKTHVANGPAMRRAVAVAAGLAAAGFLASAFGLALDPERTWGAYLTAFAFAVSIAVGGLVFQMIAYATNSRWMSVVRRLAESTTLALPVLAVLFVPIVFGADQLYPWAGADGALGEHAREALAHREPYLNLPAFAARGAIYFAIWIAAASILRVRSLRRDRLLAATEVEAAPGAAAIDPEKALSVDRAISCALLPLVGLAVTFAAFDWIMSLAPGWYSTIFGVYYAAGGFAAALALLLVLARAASRSPSAPLAGAMGADHTHALARLLFAIVMFWAYCAFFQALLIAIADKPEEVTFYLDRLRGPWPLLIALLVVGHFALPFLALLPRRPKRSARAMAAAGVWLLLMHLVDIYWLVMPELVGAGDAVPHWLDLAALAAVLGTAVAFAAWRQRGAPLLARGDPLLSAGLAYRSRS
jgi:Ni/Fe-hydrogenase subunit HybB-like protein